MTSNTDGNSLVDKDEFSILTSVAYTIIYPEYIYEPFNMISLELVIREATEKALS